METGNVAWIQSNKMSKHYNKTQVIKTSWCDLVSHNTYTACQQICSLNTMKWCHGSRMYTHHTNPKGINLPVLGDDPSKSKPWTLVSLKLVNCVAFSSHKIQCCGSATPEQTRLRTEGVLWKHRAKWTAVHGRSVRMCLFMVSAKLRRNSLSVHGTSHLQCRTSHLHQLVVLLLKRNWCERVKVTRNVFRSATFGVKPFFFLINTFY